MQIIEVCESKRKSLTEEQVLEKSKNIFERQLKVKRVRLCETHESSTTVYTGKTSQFNNKTKIYRYNLHENFKTHEHFNTLQMPSKKYENLFDEIGWENKTLMDSLIHFYKIIYFQQTKVDLTYFDISKIILLCGPPGTGKSTIARAVFQRVSIRMAKESYLVELNASKIFTRFYGDTTSSLGKILEGLEKLSESKMLFIVIDEIETLFINRSISLNNNEPLEGIRVVNTLLLFLDRIKLKKNIFIIFTSNFYDYLDPAFTDRCDIVLMTSLPNEKSTHLLLKGIFKKMMESSLMEFENVPEYDSVNKDIIKRIYTCVKGHSPRSLKKLVFHKMSIRKTTLVSLCQKLHGDCVVTEC